MSVVDRNHAQDEGELAQGQHLPELTPRELSVLAYIVRGYSHKEIAKALGIAIGTVNVFVYRIRLKTRARSRRELVLAAEMYGIPTGGDLETKAADLAQVEEAWPKVPDAVRAAILSLVQAVQVPGGDGANLPLNISPPTILG